MPPSDGALFEMLVPGEGDPLGLWTTVSPVPDAGLHFGLQAGAAEPAAPPPDTPVYRARLPADPSLADRALASQEQLAQLSDQALESVPARLDAFVARQEASRPADGGEAVHFGVGEAPSETGPEADLLGLLAEAEVAGSSAPSQLVDFGIIDEAISPALAEAREKFDALLEQVDREVLHFAWVETDAGADPLARSTVDWSGDTVTVWADDIAAEQVALHNRTLHLAVASRALKLRMAFVIATGAGKLTLLLTTPGAQALALPAAYRFVTQVLAQVREYQALTGT